MKLLMIVVLLARMAGAVVIEGTTPSGKFKTVGLSENGRFLVEGSSIAAHVIVDSGTVTAYQGGAPWAVTTAIGVSVQVAPSTTSIMMSDQFIFTTVAAVCYPADALRKQGVLCNSSGSSVMMVGDSGVTTATGALLGPGGCLAPDNPTAYIGSIYCVGVSSGTGFYTYFK